MFEPCGKCNDGWVIDDSEEAAEKCDCLIVYQAQMTSRIKREKAGIADHERSVNDLHLKDASLLLKLKHYSDNLTLKMAKGCHLYFHGHNNSSKTYSAKSVLYDACAKGLDCKFIIMGDLVDLISDGFANDEKKKEIDSILSCSLLVIDDAFDKDKILIYKSGYQLSFLDRFLRRRIESLGLNTIFTSNVPIEEIESNGFSYDIQNLIERSVKLRGGLMEFKDTFVSEEHDIDIKSIWD